MSSEAAELESGLLKESVAAFIRGASMEVTPHDDAHLPELRSILAPGTVVYVAHTPKARLEEVVRTARKVQESGLRACAHIAARRIQSERELRAGLEQLHEAGCDRVLLVAGDCDEPAGPYSSTLDILGSGMTIECGFRTIGVAGHPEGHPRVDTEGLWKALEAKQVFADAHGAGLYVVTQFGFNAQHTIAWGRQLRERRIRLPVHVGLAGPAPIGKLVRYAIHCGIGASLKAAVTRSNLVSTLSKAVRSVDELVVALVRDRTPAGPVVLVQPHFFSFGGCLATARWICAVGEGDFEMHADAAGFDVKL